ncbi:iron ABC transporter permease [Mangrovicoccus sp. HB161399]|uniref:iron ABC transporter permease n=1 Tax=Mangrovicoccus sp. HB161399 TaxID=2720392 RepID=UPI001554C62E|nr:iron ABC transporter permease [Mangrovicoccus sp. HB161399]
MKAARALDSRPVLRSRMGDIRLGNLAAAAALLAVIALLAAATLAGADRHALVDIRLPRLLLALLAGWSTAMAGAMLQSLARNPLADPGLLGLSQGALLALLILRIALPALPPGLMPLAALAGGLGTAAALAALTRGTSGGLPVLLMGIALETVLSSVTMILILYTPPELSHGISAWLSGSFALAGWEQLRALLPWLALSLPAAWALGPGLRGLELGDDLARATGIATARLRPAILVTAVLLTAAPVVAVGPLMFLGVMAPHIAAAISPATGRARLLLSGLAGAALAAGADLLTQRSGTAFALPAGLALTLTGVPLFVITLRLRALRQGRSA